MRRCLIGLIFLLAAMMIWMSAQAESAQNIIPQCRITVNDKKTSGTPVMWDQDYTTYYKLAPNRYMTIDAGEEQISGPFIEFFENSYPIEVQYETEDGYLTAGNISGEYLSEWLELPMTAHRIRLVNCSERYIRFGELTIASAGDKPTCAANWRRVDKTDMMLVVAHPDDELLWFGGLLPYYAGERHITVQVVYLVPTTGRRRMELLAGLWQCGVDIYPEFCGFRDKQKSDLASQYKAWNEKKILSTITTLIRKHKPEVIVTHSFKGETGHMAHQLVADACKRCIELASDNGYHNESLKEYGAWQVAKLYVHQYEKNQIRMDWEQPLTAFCGKTAMEVADSALQLHKSQTKHGWSMERAARHDPSGFGLYMSTVGIDIVGGDFL